MFICLQDLRLFLCWDSEGVEERDDTVVEELFNCVDKDLSDAERRPRKKDTRKRKKRRHSSSSSESEDNKSSSASRASSSSSSNDPGLFNKWNYQSV